MFDVALQFLTSMIPIIPIFTAVILAFNIISSLLWDK